MDAGTYLLGTGYDANAAMEAAKCFLCLSRAQAKAIQTYAVAVMAGGSTDPATLLESAACMRCIPAPLVDAVQSVLLGAMSGSVLTADELAAASACAECIPAGYIEHLKAYEWAVKAEITTDPAELAELSKCFMCLSEEQHGMIQTWMLCQLSELGTCSNPGSGELPVTPQLRWYVRIHHAAGSAQVNAGILTQIPEVVTFDPTACAVTITDGGGDTFDCYEVGEIT